MIFHQVFQWITAMKTRKSNSVVRGVVRTVPAQPRADRSPSRSRWCGTNGTWCLCPEVCQRPAGCWAALGDGLAVDPGVGGGGLGLPGGDDDSMAWGGQNFRAKEFRCE